MTDEELIGQLLAIGFSGTTVPRDARALFVRGVGNAILFSRNIESLEQVVALNTELFSLGSEAHPMLVSVDQEGGRVARLRGICTDVPAMRTVGQASNDDPDLPYRIGAMMARELSALGFHLDFAPVLDVDTNPDNPVIGERAFAREADEVAQHAVQFLRGLQQAGVAGCGKHFPGHGDTDTDSHLALPRLPHDLERLHAVELLPFRLAIEAGAASIMTAHVMFPALDPDLPATLSPRILDGLLRRTLGYDGVVISDDLEMRALSDHFTIDEMIAYGLNAGVDLFLICSDTDRAEQALAAGVRALVDKTVPRARVEQAAARVAALKERFVGAPAAPSLADARAQVRARPHLDLIAPLAGAGASSRGLSPVDRA